VHATTIGMMLGIANGALLIQPTKADQSDSVMGLLTLGAAVGTVGGFVYGQNADLTSGQSTFLANMVLLGVSTAAMGSILASTDGKYGSPENTALLLGTDGAAVAGALIAPHLDWSAYRAKFVLAGTIIGAFAGGLVAGLATKQQMNSDGTTNDANGDVVTASMTAGLWGGFALAILMSKDELPDYRYQKKPTPASNTVTTPWVGPHGSVGVMTGGRF